MPVRCSLKTKMVLATLLLVVGLQATAGFLVLHFFESRLKETISSQQLTLVSRIAEDIDNNIERARRAIILAAAAIPTAILNDPDRVQDFLDSRLWLEAQNLFDNGIFLFNAEGRLVAETPFHPGRRGKDYSFRDYFRQALAAKKPLISDPYFSSQEHRHPAVNFTAPVLDPGGEVVAVIAGSVDLTGDNFLGGLARVEVGRSGYLYLFNTDRLMIMHPDPSRILKRDVPPGANLLFDRAIAGFEGTGETVNSRGLHALASFRRLRSVDWILAANFPAAEAFAPIREARVLIALGLTSAFFITALVVWTTMGFLTDPLREFISHVRGLAPGEVRREPVPVRTGDEIGLLAATFNRLMEAIEKEKNFSRAQVDFLQTMIDTIPNPVYYKDAEGRYLGCNRAFEKIHGKSGDELKGRTVLDVASMPLAEELHREDMELLEQRGGEFQIFEKTLLYEDGKARDVLFYKTAFHHPGGSLGGLVGTIIDISQRKMFESALARQKDFSENLLQNAAVPCFVLDTNHCVLIWNHACEELTGIPAPEIIGSDRHWTAFYPEKRPCLADIILDGNLEETLDLYQSFANSLLIPEGLQAEGWYPRVGGKERYLFFEAAPIRNRDGELVAVIETLQDISGQKRVEEALRRSEESFRILLERSPDALLVLEEEAIVFGNVAATRLFGADSLEALAGKNILSMVGPEDRDRVAACLAETREEAESIPCLDVKIFPAGGQAVDVEACFNPVYYGRRAATQISFRDITERKEQQERVWRQANFDPLTGLPNRRLFHDRLTQAMARAERERYSVALMYLDLDRFKAVNDTLGHAAGDALLKLVADRLSALLRKSDTVARLGGDEFTVVMPQVTDASTVGRVARRILATLNEPYELPEGTGCISASVGIAFFPDDGVDADVLMKHADAAMYRAKQGGRSTFTFYAPGPVASLQPTAGEG